jgi:predicted dienelactone hydrolase
MEDTKPGTVKRREFCRGLAAALPLARAASAADRRYDPLAIADAPRPAPVDLTVHDATRSRDIPVRVYLPASRAAAPVVLFSHGLGGSREGSAFLGTHWAARGYVAVFLQHPGSDVDVWRGKPVAQRMAALKQAANLKNLLLRVKDVQAVLDQLERWNHAAGHALSGRLDMARIGMSGHSFGAVTTEFVSGERVPLEGTSLADPRIRAAVIFSPSTPRAEDPKRAFGSVKIPWMLMTGTEDIAAIGDAGMASRLGVFPALPPGGKYELVLYKAEHSAFTDRPLPGDKESRNPNHHRVILALSTAFWDAWLRGDAAARAWLDGSGPASVLEKNDRWQKK